jgi:RimJ/RimL family protein N-acetyltransferase
VSQIHTERLILRRHRLGDLADSLAMWSDPDVTRFIGGAPSTEQQVWFRLLNYAGHWALLNFGFWAVEEAASGRFIGELGFANFKRDIEPEMREPPEIGWAFTTHSRGKGFATEAVRAAVAWGDERFGAARTVCLIGPENIASIRVAEKCGYREFKRSEFNGKPVLFFERGASFIAERIARI